MDTITSKDGTSIYFKDWGKGPVVTFSHGWPLNADAWDGQMLFLVQQGLRVIAHDRRGHGRSGQTSCGNDMNSYADDLAALVETLDLRNVTMVGHSTGALHRPARHQACSKSRVDFRSSAAATENPREPRRPASRSV